jgi:hypothetical protein
MVTTAIGVSPQCCKRRVGKSIISELIGCGGRVFSDFFLGRATGVSGWRVYLLRDSRGQLFYDRSGSKIYYLDLAAFG